MPFFVITPPCVVLSCLFRALIFLMSRGVRNIEALDLGHTGTSGPHRTHLSFAFLRVSVPPWCKGFGFGCGSDIYYRRTTRRDAMRAVLCRELGGPEKLVVEDVPPPPRRAGAV